jgi:dihydropyrimidinase
LGRFVEVTSTNAAKLFGLYPQKGTIAIGSDADLVIFDPERTDTIRRAEGKSNSDYSAFEGWKVIGWPEITLRRGEVVFKEDEILGKPGSGNIISRRATMPL